MLKIFWKTFLMMLMFRALQVKKTFIAIHSMFYSKEIKITLQCTLTSGKNNNLLLLFFAAQSHLLRKMVDVATGRFYLGLFLSIADNSQVSFMAIVFILMVITALW